MAAKFYVAEGLKLDLSPSLSLSVCVGGVCMCVRWWCLYVVFACGGVCMCVVFVCVFLVIRLQFKSAFFVPQSSNPQAEYNRFAQQQIIITR